MRHIPFFMYFPLNKISHTLALTQLINTKELLQISESPFYLSKQRANP